MVTLELVQKTLRCLNTSELIVLALENNIKFHSNMNRVEIINNLLKPNLIGGGLKEIEWEKTEPLLLEGILTRLTRNDIENLRRTNKYFKSRLSKLITEPYFKNLIESRPKIIKTPKEIEVVKWEPNGFRIASLDSDKIVRMWDSNTGHLDKHFRNIYGVEAFTWSPDGKRLASIHTWDISILIWDSDAGDQMERLSGQWERVVSMAWSRESLASSGYNGTIRIWNPNTLRQIGDDLVGHVGPVTSVSLLSLPDSNRLVSGGNDRTLRIWDSYTGHPIGNPLIGHQYSIKHVEWSPDGTRIISIDNEGNIKMWTSDANQPDTFVERTLESPGGQEWNPIPNAQFITWSPDGQRLASIGYDDDSIQIWDSDTGVQLEKFEMDERVNSISWSPDGMKLASGGASGNDDENSGQITVWTPLSGVVRSSDSNFV